MTATPLTEVSAARVELVPAGDQAARDWLARELHDSAVQTMTAMLVELEAMRRATASDVLRTQLERQQEGVRKALDELRAVIYGLRSEGAGDPLSGSVASMLDRLERRTGIEATLEVEASWSDDLAPHVAMNVRRIVEESLTNVANHSGARHVTVRLSGAEGGFRVTVMDDGRGIERGGGPAGEGLGLIGMRERAAVVGGTLTVHPAPGDGGTIVHLRVDRASRNHAA